MKEGLIRDILKIEWEMFHNVQNVGGPASCQQDYETFDIMRSSQAMSWTLPLLESYLNDLKEAQESGRNLMTEKYAHMMKYTFPSEYAQLADSLPALDSQTQFLIDRIIALTIQWAQEMKQKYPDLLITARPLYSSEDSPQGTSIETYAKGELATYSFHTLQLLYDFYINCRTEGINNYEDILLNTVKQYGFSSIEDAEKYGRPSQSSSAEFH